MPLERILVIFNTPESGLILDGEGKAIEEEISLTSTLRADRLWSPEECPGHGLWVWDGYPQYFPDGDGGQYEFIKGNWRLPTEIEWAYFRLTNIFEFPEENEVFHIINEQSKTIVEVKS